MSQNNSMDQKVEAPLFEVRLTPHRSLSPRGFVIISWILLLVGFAHGTLFLTIGAWPVVGFAGLEWLLFWWLFRRHFRGDASAERLSLYRDRLMLENRDAKGAVTRLDLQPYWLRVILEETSAMSSRLYLASHGRYVEVGRFLSVEERSRLAETLRQELARLRTRS